MRKIGEWASIDETLVENYFLATSPQVHMTESFNRTSAVDFICTKCGRCCQKIGNSDLTRWLDRGDGTCRNFDETTKRCRIYDTRPLVCRVDDAYKFFSAELSLHDYYQLNITVCNDLQTE